MTADLFLRKKNAFVLWRVSNPVPAPVLVIGEFRMGAPVQLADERQLLLQQDPGHPDLWSIDASRCGLQDGWIYHYWFEVSDPSGERIRITDPTAYAVNWQLQADPFGIAYAASVIKYRQGQLIACDTAGEEVLIPLSPDLGQLRPNNQTVIYELPTAWTKVDIEGEREIGTGSFSDIIALIDAGAQGGNFSDLAVLQPGRSYLSELGITALELLPPADSYDNRDWGYHTTNFLSPDYDLGSQPAYSWAVPNRDLQTLTMTCHTNGIRFIIDSVMAFAKFHPYLAASPEDFFIDPKNAQADDPDLWNSRQGDDRIWRNGFGSTLFRYSTPAESYDPIGGGRDQLYPARQLMKMALLRWIADFRIDGVRIDSVENVASWDFIQEYRNTARTAWQAFSGGDPDTHFFVVGEELTEPHDLLRQGRLDAIWHEQFKRYIRKAVTGHAADDESSFEWTVRKAIDCRYAGFDGLTKAVVYLTSHDVEGMGNERLYNYLVNNGITDTEKRIKLAFACLLTAVGIPMILAGEEFADQHDLFDQHGNVDQRGGKQVDPVNYSRAGQDWRNRIKVLVSRLIACRTNNPALSVDDTDFFHTDFESGKRVMAWRRGIPGSADAVVVVANFSDYGTPDPAGPGSEYRVNNWPAAAAGRTWFEVTQQYAVGEGWAGREPIYPWEAKVYELR